MERRTKRPRPSCATTIIERKLPPFPRALAHDGGDGPNANDAADDGGGGYADGQRGHGAVCNAGDHQRVQAPGL